MTDTQQIAQDLEFVKAAVQRQEQSSPKTPLAIAILWGLILLGGCLFNDLEPRHCWIYWMIAPPVGYALSFILGGRAAMRSGQCNPADGIKQAMHWSIIFVGSVPPVLLAATGQINGWQMGQLLFLVSGLVYYLAGVHLDRRFILSGLAMIGSAAVLTWVFPFAWTICGAAICASLIVGFALPFKKVERANANA